MFGDEDLREFSRFEEKVEVDDPGGEDMRWKMLEIAVEREQSQEAKALGDLLENIDAPLRPDRLYYPGQTYEPEVHAPASNLVHFFQILILWISCSRLQ